MRVLVLGATGMLGHQVLRSLQGKFEVTGAYRGTGALSALRRLVPDVPLQPGVAAEDIESIRRVIEASRAEVVINCVGVVKQAAADPIACIVANALLPHQLAKLTAARGIRLIHFSTDCVFSGAHGPYGETDDPDPIDQYGRTKVLGECLEPNVLTLRLSIVGHELQWHRGLIDWFLRQRGGRIRGYSKALYSGLTTIALGNLLESLLRQSPALSGLWHVSAEAISKFDLLHIVNRIYKLNVEIEKDVDYVCDRRLDSSRFRAAVNWHPASWEKMIQAMADDYGATRA